MLSQVRVAFLGRSHPVYQEIMMALALGVLYKVWKIERHLAPR